MSKRVLLKSAVLLSVFAVVSALMLAPAVTALELERVTYWYWTSGAYISSVATGDVDADGFVEIVTGGSYYDGTRAIAQLCVWAGTNPGLENVMTWHWIENTYIWSVAVGDVDDDGSVEIVTGGYYEDEVGIYHAQLCVWDGASLTLENVRAWHWTSYTFIYSVAVGDVDADDSAEIITGGSYIDETRKNAQLCVWDGSTLALEQVAAWYWADPSTEIYSVAVDDVDADDSVEIVTGGSYYDGTRGYAQLCVWSGSTLVLENVRAWYWIADTALFSVAVGDVDDDGSVEIITGGYCGDGTRYVAQLCVWSGSTLALKNFGTWYWGLMTSINSVAVGDVDADSSVEIITGAYYADAVREDNAQLCIWNGSTLALENVEAWYWISETGINSVVVSDVDDDDSVEIVTGGQYYDETRTVAQLAVWTN